MCDHQGTLVKLWSTIWFGHVNAEHGLTCSGNHALATCVTNHMAVAMQSFVVTHVPKQQVKALDTLIS